MSHALLVRSNGDLIAGGRFQNSGTTYQAILDDPSVGLVSTNRFRDVVQ